MKSDATPKTTFEKFERAGYEEESTTANILRDGVKCGTITRNMRWNFRSVSSRSLVPEVLGYEVDFPGFEGREFMVDSSGTAAKALAAAQSFARAWQPS